ncbi:type III pantothenate kinase [Stutzerimonas stutzeri]|uniref:type III pantothenate kinase n=1 Tax=Stutzerimonas stutzeri TaxID=316 RepID=UPI001C2E8395|nr:type III pantothenate kinase [Stutzerimonas stutzeri]
MILELDCGNSFVKWRVITEPGASPVAEGVSTQADELARQLSDRNVGGISRCRLVSVRSDEETAAIVSVLSASLSVDVAIARPANSIAGVVNGYNDPWRLGLDRWLAIVAAYELCKRACLVVDLGTAITVDLVARDGAHLGGYIAPGIALLRGQLFAHTRRIRYDRSETESALDDLAPGKDTAEGVERGCLLMARSYVSSQIALARNYLGDDFAIYVTGGDVALVADFPSVNCVPDLVFRGLAIACP